MHNVLMRLERKSGLEHGGIVPLGRRAPETKDATDDEEFHVSPGTKKLFEIIATEVKTLRGKGDETQRRLDEALIDARRPHRGGHEDKTHSVMPKVWNDYFRHGIEAAEIKALSAGNNPDGGFTVIPSLSTTIDKAARNRSDIRQIANVINISTGSYESLINPSTITSGWVGEQTARPQTTSPQIVKNTFMAHEIYAFPSATQTLLDDSAVNIEQWLSDEINDELSVQENTAFVVGDGVAKPRGFMNQTFVANASWTWGNVGFLVSGLAGGFVVPTTSVSPADALINLVYALKAGYRANATWVMNSNTAGIVRKFKNADGSFIWQQSLIAGQPSFLLGYPVAIAEDMADVAADSFPIAFGDFRRAYYIIDRIGVRILRDPFTAKPFVMFYTTKRVGGGVHNYDAFKVLKISV